MRRPVDVKAHFRFLLSVSLFLFSQVFPALCRDGLGLNDVLLGPQPFCH